MKIGVAVRMLTVGMVLATLAGGCAEEDIETSIIEVEGTVMKINPNARTVTVRSYNKKNDREVEAVVEIGDETEIMINGSLAKLSDVKIGERARGNVRIIRQDEEKRFVALRVQVERAEVIVAPTATPEAEGDDASKTGATKTGTSKSES
jgi:hypothetical protein